MSVYMFFLFHLHYSQSRIIDQYISICKCCWYRQGSFESTEKNPIYTICVKKIRNIPPQFTLSSLQFRWTDAGRRQRAGSKPELVPTCSRWPQRKSVCFDACSCLVQRAAVILLLCARSFVQLQTACQPRRAVRRPAGRRKARGGRKERFLSRGEAFGESEGQLLIHTHIHTHACHVLHFFMAETCSIKRCNG